MSNIDKDKLLHYFYGSVTLYSLLLFFDVYTASLIVGVIAGAKEIIYDHFMKKGNCELWDFLFSIAPCILHIIIELF